MYGSQGQDETWTFPERLILVVWAEVTFVVSVVVVLGHPPELLLTVVLGAVLGLWLELEAAQRQPSGPAGG